MALDRIRLNATPLFKRGTLIAEGIASAIFEEKNATDGRLAAGRKLTEKVNEADKSLFHLLERL